MVYVLLKVLVVEGQDEAYNDLKRDGSFEFGYNNPDSYHHAQGNRNNVVRGQFGGRSPATGTKHILLLTSRHFYVLLLYKKVLGYAN